MLRSVQQGAGLDAVFGRTEYVSSNVGQRAGLIGEVFFGDFGGVYGVGKL